MREGRIYAFLPTGLELNCTDGHKQNGGGEEDKRVSFVYDVRSSVDVPVCTALLTAHKTSIPLSFSKAFVQVVPTHTHAFYGYTHFTIRHNSWANYSVIVDKVLAKYP